MGNGGQVTDQDQQPLPVGIPVIDSQHARWTEIANRLAESVELGHGDHVIGATLSELAEFTASHFSDEEYLMGRCVHLGLMDEESARGHSHVHDMIMKELSRLVYDFEFSKNVVTGETVAFIRRWYTEHLEIFDSVLGAALRAMGRAAR